MSFPPRQSPMDSVFRNFIHYLDVIYQIFLSLCIHDICLFIQCVWIQAYMCYSVHVELRWQVWNLLLRLRWDLSLFSAASARLSVMWTFGDLPPSASHFFTWALSLQTCTAAPCPTLYGFWRFERRFSSLCEKHFIHWAIFSFHPRMGIPSEGLPHAVMTLACLISACRADRLKQVGYVLVSRGRILS